MLELGSCGYSEILPLTRSIDRNPSDDRYLKYQSSRNVNCKFSKLNELSEFSRMGNENEKFTNERDNNLMNILPDTTSKKPFVTPLMSINIKPYKSQEANFTFVNGIENCGMNSVNPDCQNGEFQLLNNKVNQIFQNLNFNSHHAQSKQLNCGNKYDADEQQSSKRSSCGTNRLWEGELNIKRSKVDETASKIDYKHIDKTYSYKSEELPFNVKKSVLEEDNFEDYFIGIPVNVSEKGCKKKESKIMNDIPVVVPLVSEDSSGFMKFSVFDYCHKPVDVKKLPIVQPFVNLEGKKSESILSNKVSETFDVNHHKSVDCNDEFSLPRPCKRDGGKKHDYSKNSKSPDLTISCCGTWKLIPLDCPMRVTVSKFTIDMGKCSQQDPRIKHLLN